VSIKQRLTGLENHHAGALAKQRGCTDDEAMLNLLYELAKRLETHRLHHAYPCYPECSLSALERDILAGIREASLTPEAQKRDPWAPELVAFCNAALTFPVNEAANAAPGWVRWSQDGVTPVTSLAWILQMGLGRPVLGNKAVKL
jgi:hypothetical protein